MIVDDGWQTGEDDKAAAVCEVPDTRRLFLRKAASWSLPRRVSVASAALFAGIAARGAPNAEAHAGQGNFRCCSLARPDQWCAPAGADVFWCDHGGFKRVWYCCDTDGVFVGCGECQSSTGTCFNGPTWYCSYGWVERTFC